MKWQTKTIAGMRLGFLSLTVLSACMPARTSTSRAKADGGDEFAKLGWIEKVSRTLSCGKTPLAPDEISAMVDLPNGEIVDKLMQGYRYEATLLDFTKFFNNTSKTQTECLADQQNLSKPEQLQNIVSNYSFRPHILRAAKAAASDGDFLGEMFAEGPIAILAPIRVKTISSTSGGFPLAPSDIGSNGATGAPPPPTATTMAERAASYRDELLARVDAAIAAFGPDEALDVVKGCRSVYGKSLVPAPGESAFSMTLSNVTFRTLNNAGLSQIFDGQLSSNWLAVVNNDCSPVGFAIDPPPPAEGETPPPPPTYPDIDAKKLKDRLTLARPKIAKAFQLAIDFNSEVYKPASLAELKSAPPRDEFLLPNDSQNQFAFAAPFPYLEFGGLQNSSTNYNRKRGAFMLKTYFCDDLTPVAIVAPEAHGEGAHASDAGCQACHYKLDPMSGFFREMSGFGPGFATPGAPLTSLSFSDGKVIQGDELKHYLETWKAPEAAGHEWNVGYVRSTTKPAVNYYASSLKELYSFMSTAPEVKSCVVRRLAEYFVGKEQAFDGGYLAYLEDKLKPAAATSANGLGQVVRELMLSKTFAEPDPVSSSCYDFKPGAAPSGLPCEVAWTLKTYCEKCHQDDTSFDLSQWKPLAGGHGFPHLGEDGVAIDRLETFKRMRARLDTPDKTLRMPKNQEMPDAERARLYKWVSAVLDGAGGTPP